MYVENKSSVFGKLWSSFEKLGKQRTFGEGGGPREHPRVAISMVFPS